jgi:DNA-binding response OmpR family regulator
MYLLPFPGFTFNAPKMTPVLRLTIPGETLPRQKTDPALSSNGIKVPLIYVVDDESHLTELYTILLQAAGCRVRAFNDRVEALRALKLEKRRPDLLIVDYLGNSMLAEQFIHRCREVCPGLQIMMASGLGQSELRFTSVSAERFLQKPFAVEEFLREVRAALPAVLGR